MVSYLGPGWLSVRMGWLYRAWLTHSAKVSLINIEFEFDEVVQNVEVYILDRYIIDTLTFVTPLLYDDVTN